MVEVKDYESSRLTDLIRGKMCFSDLQKQFTEYFRNFKILLRYVFVTVLFCFTASPKTHERYHHYLISYVDNPTSRNHSLIYTRVPDVCFRNIKTNTKG
ncbi:hypothetical protein SAMN04488524_1148 [Pedobacter africanus]|uniref:Uncharacterized protein n=1 Tax=Pedobacter africanus TaxID=151894 RepID=A0A1W2A152_9SPHI|nr:hypothetical protein SAMN04488524_1148 [Pedobacter africanus]